MASLRMTVGTVFDTVGTTAVAASTAINMVVHGINIADAYVKQASKDQQDRMAGHRLTFQEKLKEELATEDSSRQLKVAEFRAKSELHATLYDQNYARYDALFSQKE